jgi:hypothetical protein
MSGALLRREVGDRDKEKNMEGRAEEVVSLYCSFLHIF